MIRRRRTAFVTTSLLLFASFLAAVPVADAAQGRAFVFATDFASGNIASVSFGPPPVAACNVAPTCADAVLRYHQGLLYVVERFGCDNVRVLDPNASFAVVQQFSVGNGANPNDIAIVSPTKAFSMGRVKLGHPVPESNLSRLSKSGVSLHTEK